MLGFDDHYKKDSDVITELIPFEKYYQRIIKRNDSVYFDWLDKFRNEEDLTIHIYGHSCAQSDGDVLKKFLQIENSKVIIYYIDERDRAEKVKNLAVVLEPDELIKLTSGSDPHIRFYMVDNETNIISDN